MKRVIIAVLLFASSAISLMAASHTVIRGESLQSIAAKYNITTEQLLAANPGADQLFYVGLKLTIPENTTSNTVANTQSPSSSETTSTYTASAAAGSTTEQPKSYEDTPGAEFAMMIEYGFLPKTGGSGNYAYAATAGANYYFMQKNSGLFAGARIGYNSARLNQYTSDHRGSYTDLTITSHFITLPINVGYALTTSNKTFGITPYAGLDVNFCVAGKSEIKAHIPGHTETKSGDLKKKVGVDARIGLQFRLWGFNVGASYVFPLNDNQKMYFTDDSYLAVNLGWGF